MEGAGRRLGVLPGRAEVRRVSISSVTTLLVLAAIYAVAGKIGLGFAFLNESASPIWPPTGIALAAAILLGRRLWPGIFLGAFLVNVSTTGSIATSLGISVGNTLEALLGAWLVERFAGGRRAFQRLHDTVLFILLGAVLAPGVSATCGVTSLALGGFERWENYLPVWITWLLGDAVSALTIAPLLLIWAVPPLPRWSWRAVGEAILASAVAVSVVVLVFAGSSPYVTRAFLCFPLLLWPTFRFGQRGAISAAVALSAVALWGTAQGGGPFTSPDRNLSLLLLQSFVGLVTITNLVLGAVVSEWRRAQEALAASEANERSRAAHLAALIEAVPAAIWVAGDADGRVVAANRAAQDLQRRPEEEVVAAASPAPSGETPPATTPRVGGPGLRPEEAALRRSLRGEQVRGLEAEVRLADGTFRHLLGNAGPVRDAEGRPRGAVAAFVDISARTRAEEALRRSEALLAGLIESAMDAIIAVDAGQRIVVFNPAAEAMFRCPAAAALGRPLDRFIPPAYREVHHAHIEQFGRTGATTRRMGRLGAVSGLRADGEEFPIEASISNLEVGGRKLFTVILRDITERRRTEEDLEAWQHELEARVDDRTAELAAARQRLEAELDERQRLEAAVAHASEREQLRLGQELHDGLGQQLAGVGFLLAAIQARSRERDPGTADDLERLREMVAEGINLTRSLAKGFYPVEIETLGLQPALEAAAHGTSRLFGVRCVVDSVHASAGALTGPRAIQLFRLAQEAVHNAVRHAHAQRVVVRLTADDRELTLTVEDDGIGFPDDVAQASGMGLRIMRHRARLLGGRLDLGRGPSGGASVRCTVPRPE